MSLDAPSSPSPSSSPRCSPRCGRCQALMRFVIEIPQVSEPGSVQIFECAAGGKIEFRPET
jgi:hypothetical protein